MGDTDITVTYDPSILKFVSGTNATGGDGTVKLSAKGDGTSMEVSYSMEFTALKEGTATLEVKEYTAYLANDEALNLTLGTSQVTIQGGTPVPELSLIHISMSKLDKLDFKTVDTSNLEIYQDTGEFTNIALFGLDSREGELDGGVRSDSMMIASIDNKTKNVKVVSVFRDTLTQQDDGTYEKANAAYSFGGPEEAIALLNRNFDLDISKYMSVNFNALADVIDLLGGIEIDLTAEEVFWTNGYCTETSQVVGRKTTELTQPGNQLLDGIQAVSYARIRYTEGDVYKRQGMRTEV